MRRPWHWLMHFVGWNVGEVCLAALKALATHHASETNPEEDPR